MSQKLAIAISGAVSLGSFESGVMYEIIEAIAQHNQHTETTEDQKIIIDVITGASAGAMTAAILAQKLLLKQINSAILSRMTFTEHGWRKLILAHCFSLEVTIILIWLFSPLALSSKLARSIY